MKHEQPARALCVRYQRPYGLAGGALRAAQAAGRSPHVPHRRSARLSFVPKVALGKRCNEANFDKEADHCLNRGQRRNRVS